MQTSRQSHRASAASPRYIHCTRIITACSASAGRPGQYSRSNEQRAERTREYLYNDDDKNIEGYAPIQKTVSPPTEEELASGKLRLLAAVAQRAYERGAALPEPYVGAIVVSRIPGEMMDCSLMKCWQPANHDLDISCISW